MTFLWGILLRYFGGVWKKLAIYATGALLVALMIFGLVQYGKGVESEKQVTRELKTYKQTRKRIDEVPISPDVTTAIERLRGNGDIRQR
jgi:hypothetical protein